MPAGRPTGSLPAASEGPPCAIAEAEEDGERAAVGIRHEADLAGGGGEAGSSGPFGHAHGIHLGQLGNSRAGDGMDGNGRFAAVGGQEAIGHGGLSGRQGQVAGIMARWRGRDNPGDVRPSARGH